MGTTIRGIVAGAVACVAALTMSASARAADQFTLDAHADSFAPIVTDADGNGYVAWERSDGSAADIPMFCKLAPGATACAHPVALGLPGGGADDANGALALFSILGPGHTVWVVTDRYIRDDTVIWTSTDGGASFGAPLDIPSGEQCLVGAPCQDSEPYTNLTGLDDTDPVTSTGTTYDGQSTLGPLGQPFVNFLQSSTNPGLGFDWDATDVAYQFEPGVSEFTFADAPSYIDLQASALGTTETGDVVEAVTDDATSPDTVQAFSYAASATYPSVFSATQAGFSGPVSFPHSYGPRLADGHAGLFMATGDDPSGAAPAIDLREWNATTHSFGAAQKVGPIAAADAGDAGGLGEDYDTGELVTAWPTQTATGSDLMTAQLSTNGGSTFSSAQDIATITGVDGSFGSVRVAVARSGTGFVTFEDSRGLQVADLRPLATQFGQLRLQNRALQVPVTCAAPVHGCEVHLALTVGGTHVTRTDHVAPGATRTLAIAPSASELSTITSGHHRVAGTLTVTIDAPGTSPDTIVLHPSL